MNARCVLCGDPATHTEQEPHIIVAVCNACVDPNYHKEQAA